MVTRLTSCTISNGCHLAGRMDRHAQDRHSGNCEQAEISPSPQERCLQQLSRLDNRALRLLAQGFCSRAKRLNRRFTGESSCSRKARQMRCSESPRWQTASDQEQASVILVSIMSALSKLITFCSPKGKETKSHQRPSAISIP